MANNKSTKNRGHNEGSIYQRKDGRWCAAVTINKDPFSGKPKRNYIYGKSKEEVRKQLIAMQHQINEGTYKEPNKMLLKDWLDTWLYQYKKNNLKPKTFESYEGLIRLHLKPTIGNVKLDKLQPHQIQMLLNKKIEAGLSSRTVRYISVVLHSALKQAVKNNIIIINPADAISLPHCKKKGIRVLTQEEQAQFIKTVKTHRLGMAFILDLATGLRLGELLALEWKDVDLKAGIIHVTKSVQYVKDFDKHAITKYKTIIQDPKTEAGKRDICIPNNIIAELKKYKIQLNEEKLSSENYEDNGLLFCTESGKILNRSNFERTFRRLVKQAKIPNINFNALRHTYATRMLEMNVHPKIVQELMGHSNISVTLDTYSSVLPQVKHDAVEKINYLFTEVK